MTERYKKILETREMGKTRIALFVRILSSGIKFNCRELQDIVKNRLVYTVDRKTVSRDMDAISRVIPIEVTRGRYGGYQMIDVRRRCRDVN